MVASRAPRTGNLARTPGMCPDWEVNQRPFGSQSSAQSTEPHQPGLPFTLLNHICLGAAYSAYCHSEAFPQETIRNTGAGTAGLEFGNTGKKSAWG